MKILVLGDDGRAHVLAWKLFTSSLAHEVLCAPGNGGTGQLVPSVSLPHEDASAAARWSFDEQVDLIISADGVALTAGLVDEAAALHIAAFGPPHRTATFTASRCALKELLLRHAIPTPAGRAFTSVDTAERYLATQPLPVMIKADHPVAGEAVYDDRHAAMAGIRELFATATPAGSNNGVVIEQFVQGSRAAMSAFVDGNTTVPLPAAHVYEQAAAGVRVSGVGAHTGASALAHRLTGYLHQQLLAPLAAALQADGLPVRGLLGVDCLLATDGPQLIGARWALRPGEAQVVLPRVEDDLLPWIRATLDGRLADLPAPQVAPIATVGIGLMVRGYPLATPTGGPIDGVELLDEGILLFHNATTGPALRYQERGTTPARGSLLSGLFTGSSTPATSLRVAGGMPLMLVSSAATLAGARGWGLVNAERISFDGASFRDDIAAHELGEYA